MRFVARIIGILVWVNALLAYVLKATFDCLEMKMYKCFDRKLLCHQKDNSYET